MTSAPTAANSVAAVDTVLDYLAAVARERRQAQSRCRSFDYRAADVGELVFEGAVGPGWLPLVADMHGVLIAFDPDYQLYQVTELFAGLRVHACFAPAAIELGQAAIAAAAELTASTCELCGSEGALHLERPRWKTLCEGCFVLDRRAAVEHGERYAALRLARLLSGDPRFPTPEAIIALFGL